MKLKDLFDVLPTTEYVKIFSQENILQFKGIVSEYIGELDMPILTLYSVVTWSGSVCIEIILDYEEDEK